ncbi:hypothetical protein Q1695_007515 [Nippostrongylus brasiliensis]|nr:hypothetical protein Q1695_007515 [Nippostrongylus brasiliensis]
MILRSCVPFLVTCLFSTVGSQVTKDGHLKNHQPPPREMSAPRRNSAPTEPSQALLWMALDEALQQRYGKGIHRLAEEAGIHSPSWKTPIQVAPTEDDTKDEGHPRNDGEGKPRSKKDRSTSRQSGPAARPKPPHYLPRRVERTHVHFGQARYAQRPPPELAHVVAAITNPLFEVSKSGYVFFIFIG